jgi:predicted GNAT family N-acyltransferase
MSILIKVADFASDFSSIKQIRYAVFQVEQGINAEDEFDGKDVESIHLLAYFVDLSVGTVRIREVSKEIVKIERLAVLKNFRTQGLGKRLMERAIALVKEQFKGEHKLIKVHAQVYLEKFYLNLGFVTQGESFVEAGIHHILMLKDLSN